MPTDSRSFGFARGAVVEVCWIDSAQSHGWTDREDEVANPARLRSTRCRSVGYVLQDTEEELVLAESVNGNDVVSCITTIPKFAITDRRQLAEGVE